MRKIFLSLLFVFIIASSSFAEPGEIVYNLGADPRTIDPALNQALDGANVIINAFDGLLRTDMNDLPEPACAYSWDVSPDGLKWTFHLRDNLKWSDGEALTASHFKDGFIRALNPETGCPYAYYAFFIKNGEAFYKGMAKADDVGIYAPDDKTLILELEYAYPLLLDYLAFQIFAPVRNDIITKYSSAWAAKPESYISNGAFKLESWKHGDGGEITLVKNNHYWDADNVKVNRLRFVFINNENTAMAAFKAGRIDYNSAIPSAMRPMLLKSGEAESLPSLGTAFCSFNTTRKPFDDVRVRKAFSLAIYRKVITDKILMGGEKPATGLVCYLVPGSTDDKDFRTEGGAFLPENADVEEARRLLAEAGYPGGKNFPHVSYKYNSNPGNKAMAETLQAMWKSVLGVEVELLNEEWKVFLETRHRKDFDIARSSWIMDFSDAAGILELFITDGPQNDESYSNPKFDELMKLSAYEMNHARRIHYMHEAEKILMEDMPIAPIYFYSSSVMQSKRVKNIFRSPRGFLIFRGAYMTD